MDNKDNDDNNGLASGKKSLHESDITSDKVEVVSRRSMLGVIAGTGALATALQGCFRPARYAVVGPQPVVMQQPQAVMVQPGRVQTGVTDSDGGPYADPGGYGRGSQRNAYTGLTDSDGGAYADASGQGRGVYGRSSGLTDSDSGPNADPGGNGRGTARLQNTGLTDSDGGPYADPAGGGRGRWR